MIGAYKFSRHFFGLVLLLTPNLVEVEPSVLTAKASNYPIPVHFGSECPLYPITPA